MRAEQIQMIETPVAEGGTSCGDPKQKDILVQAAKQLFHLQGYGKTTFRDIAKQAELSIKLTQDHFPTLEDICHAVIEAHMTEQAETFETLCQESNARQRLSLYLDSFSDRAEVLVKEGCALTNLYMDVKREQGALAAHGTELLTARLGWIRQQFVLITRVEDVTDLPERLTSALHGILVMAQVTGDARLIRNQVIQLKSWIRSM